MVYIIISLIISVFTQAILLIGRLANDAQALLICTIIGGILLLAQLVFFIIGFVQVSREQES